MRRDGDTPADILRSATATNAELLMEKGRLGTIAEGARGSSRAIPWPTSAS
jgi:imidazolonepropionase-like amidohydrolase